MNRSSPVIPKFSSDPKNRARSRTRFAIFTVLGVHAGILMVLLMQGCHQEPAAPTPEIASTNPPPPVQAMNPPMVEPANAVEPTNTPVTPAAPDNAPPPVLAATNPPVVPVSSSLEYTITKGDTFSTLAKRFHVSVKAVAEANPGVEPTRLKIGQKIHLPSGAEPTALKTATTNPAEVASGENLYTVKSGDGLLKIAGQFGTTIDALRAANNLRTDRIYVGQKLKIPVKSSAQALLPQPSRQEATPSQG